MKVAIIGAGINGLAVAVNLKQTYPNLYVTIFTDKVTPNTTGDVAAGLVMPSYISREDPRIETWCRSTYHFLANIIKTDPKHHEYGIIYQDVYCLNDDRPVQIDVYDEISETCRIMNEKELRRFAPARYGTAQTSLLAGGHKILVYMNDKFISLGGIVRIQRAESFDEVQMIEDFQIVINCTGLGSRNLCNDLEVYPVRGQVIRVFAPWIKYTILKSGHYIIPQSDGVVVLGKTGQENDWNISTNEKDTKDILDGSIKLLPGLKDAKILSNKVGLRPRRSAVRIEKESRINQKTNNQYTIIHNYGHGGSGFTLFWGCSEDVVKLISDILNHY